MTLSATMAGQSATRARYFILLMLFLATTINYADRATLSIAGTPLAKDLHIDPAAMGYLFSAFSWSYVVGQLPGGWLLDRYGSKWVYGLSIFIWSIFTFMQGLVGFFFGGAAIATIFALRFLVGFAEAPAFPANARLVAAWFPSVERGTASAIFNSAQYFAAVLFTPIMAWITTQLGWKYVFFFMGALGFAMVASWGRTVYGPKDHPRISAAELDLLTRGGALVDMDAPKTCADQGPKWNYVPQLLSNRMLLGVYTAQYCVNTLTYFFLTWFPVYLVKERGMTILQAGFVAVLPALCGFIGGILGGVISDAILRKTGSLTIARKIPIVGGMLLSMSVIACNYVDGQAWVVGFMALAFFGKGVGALGWAVVSDTSPKEIGGLSGGMFNTFGNVAGIVTPIVIGYILQATGSFYGALFFVGLHGLLAVACYLLVVGKIERVVLRPA
jgi:MFS transporter, ACS family, glucarate transporter